MSNVKFSVAPGLCIEVLWTNRLVQAMHKHFQAVIAQPSIEDEPLQAAFREWKAVHKAVVNQILSLYRLTNTLPVVNDCLRVHRIGMSQTKTLYVQERGLCTVPDSDDLIITYYIESAYWSPMNELGE